MWIVSTNMEYLQCMVARNDLRSNQELLWHEKTERYNSVSSKAIGGKKPVG
ncbi:MAG: hypothetical protein C5S38_02915 [Candidatus Methanophagaceae archaeon]|nr:MAG: hypothetical protein C5S38_02915 [Methanophagales archaeon]